MTESYFLCRLDRKLYGMTVRDITTDEVIITGTQIAHIRHRHPDDYELFREYGASMIEDPDYIVEANLPFSAMILKEIDRGGRKIKLILRLKTAADPEDFKNSVITFQKIRDREWHRLLRNKKILYKKPNTV